MDLIIVYGLPASGKLTVANELVKLLPGYRVFHNHLAFDFSYSLFEYGTDEFYKFYEELIEISLKKVMEKDIDLIFTTVFNQNNTPEKFLKLEKMLLESGNTVRYVELVCSKDELYRRVVSESRKRTGKIKNAEKLKNSIEEGYVYLPKWDKEVFRIDNTEISAFQTAQKIKEHFGF